MTRATSIRILASVLATLLASGSLAEVVTVPFGTAVYCELDQEVTSRKKQWSEGDLVRAHIWKDVRVGAYVVVKAGTPVMVRVDQLQKARIAGRKGRLELAALNVVGVDGVDIPLDGGYDKSGKGKVGLAVALGVLVFVPLIFLKGKQAVLEPGTIFDAMVRNPTEIEVDISSQRPVLKVPPSFEVVVLYDEIDMEAKTIVLPMRIRSDEAFTLAEIVAINGEPIRPAVVLDLSGNPVDGAVVATTPWKPLTKMMKRGMNQLTIKAGEETAEVLLEIEF